MNEITRCQGEKLAHRLLSPGKTEEKSQYHTSLDAKSHHREDELQKLLKGRAF